jgi:hypothetical protein
MRVVVVLVGLKDGTSLAVHTTIGKIGHDTPPARWGPDASSALFDKVQDDCQSWRFVRLNFVNFVLYKNDPPPCIPPAEKSTRHASSPQEGGNDDQRI